MSDEQSKGVFFILYITFNNFAENICNYNFKIIILNLVIFLVQFGISKHS